MKLVADLRTGELLGGHIVGDGAGDMIHEVVVAMAGDVPARTVGDAIHAYPTVSETVGGAFATARRGARPLTRGAPSHEVRRVELGDLLRGVVVEPERAQAPHPMPVHRVVEFPNRSHGVGQRAGSKTARRKHHQRLLDVRRRAGGLRQERGPLFHRPAQLVAPVRVGGQVVPGVFDAERDMPRLVRPGPAHDVGGHGIGRIPLHEAR